MANATGPEASSQDEEKSANPAFHSHRSFPNTRNNDKNLIFFPFPTNDTQFITYCLITSREDF